MALDAQAAPAVGLPLVDLQWQSVGSAKKVNRLPVYSSTCTGSTTTPWRKNANRMRCGEYLSKGYPIASGVIEGACRHYVRDRLERAGMHWTRAGAQAMLDVGSEFVNGDCEGFQQFRIERETKNLYPQRPILDQVTWTLFV